MLPEVDVMYECERLFKRRFFLRALDEKLKGLVVKKIISLYFL